MSFLDHRQISKSQQKRFPYFSKRKKKYFTLFTFVCFLFFSSSHTLVKYFILYFLFYVIILAIHYVNILFVCLYFLKMRENVKLNF